MPHRILAFFATAFVGVACGSSTSNLTCMTSSQKVSFTAVGSCGGGALEHTITVSTQPGLCSLLVTGAETVGLPTQGQFTGMAAQTQYDISKGNWELLVNQGNASSGSTNIQCDVSMASSSDFTVTCSGQVCPPDDCTGGMCNPVDCVEHLTKK